MCKKCAAWQNSSFLYRRSLQRSPSVLHNVPFHVTTQLLIFIFPRRFCRSGNNGRIKNVFFSPLEHVISVFFILLLKLFQLLIWKVDWVKTFKANENIWSGCNKGQVPTHQSSQEYSSKGTLGQLQPQELSTSLGWEPVGLGWEGGPQVVLAQRVQGKKGQSCKELETPCCGILEASAHVLRRVKWVPGLWAGLGGPKGQARWVFQCPYGL